MALTTQYFITMEDARLTVLEQVEMACRAGIRMIQLRMKTASDGQFLRTTLGAKRICDAYGGLLIVNDRVELAVEAGAHGVHVGQEDLPVREARKLLGAGKIIGGTANTMEDIRDHCLGGADYIGLGPYRFTRTKKKLSPVLGLDGYRGVMAALEEKGTRIPVFAIGGIGLRDVGGLLAAGVHGIAFSGMLLEAGDPGALVKEMAVIFANQETMRKTQCEKQTDHVNDSR